MKGEFSTITITNRDVVIITSLFVIVIVLTDIHEPVLYPVKIIKSHIEEQPYMNIIVCCTYAFNNP